MIFFNSFLACNTRQNRLSPARKARKVMGHYNTKRYKEIRFVDNLVEPEIIPGGKFSLIDKPCRIKRVMLYYL